MFLSKEEKAMIKKRMDEDKSSMTHLKSLAEAAMLQGPWSVTDHVAPLSTGGRHDYYSEGPYWWPDPEQAEGPYIRRDGAFNPNQFKGHKMPLRHLCNNLLILVSAGYHLETQGYTDYAIRLMNVWFLDEATAMTPQSEFVREIGSRKKRKRRKKETKINRGKMRIS